MTVETDEWVTLGVIAAVCLLVVLVPAGSLDVFLVLTLIAILVVRTLAGLSASDTVTTSLDGFIAAGLVVFAAIVLQRVFDILAVG